MWAIKLSFKSFYFLLFYECDAYYCNKLYSTCLVEQICKSVDLFCYFEKPWKLLRYWVNFNKNKVLWNPYDCSLAPDKSKPVDIVPWQQQNTYSCTLTQWFPLWDPCDEADDFFGRNCLITLFWINIGNSSVRIWKSLELWLHFTWTSVWQNDTKIITKVFSTEIIL